MRLKKLPARIAFWIMIAALVVISLFPLVWAIFGSLKESQEMYNYPYRLFPIAPTLNNYTVLFGLSNFIQHAAYVAGYHGGFHRGGLSVGLQPDQVYLSGVQAA